MNLFKYLENNIKGSEISLLRGIKALNFNKDGLLPAIAQQYDSKEVIMMAWMNDDSIHKTLTTGRVCYWSRSRQAFWYKGELSGKIQKLIEMRFDCDGDTILVKVDQDGPACHTGRRSCFYYRVNHNHHSITIDSKPLIHPDHLYGK